MFIAMNRFKVVPGAQADFERVWTTRDSHLGDHSDPHVTAPVIHTNADAEAPRPRRAVKDSSTCHPEVARSSIRVIEGRGSAIWRVPQYWFRMCRSPSERQGSDNRVKQLTAARSA
jgi:hypothetical protein